MILLSATGLSKTYGEKVIFDDISLTINSGDKIGLIGINGTGKSSLLKMLVGLEQADGGEITTSNELAMEYLSQNPKFDDEMTVLQQIFQGESEFMRVLRDYEQVVVDLEFSPDDEGLVNKMLDLSAKMDQHNAWQLESEAKAILNKLGITDFTAKVGTLSGGQRKRIALAGALIRPSNLLILDEPTNHLDNDTIDYLENVLKNKNCALLMVTHDRYFLDRVTNKIVELDKGNLYKYDGNYAKFLELKEERDSIDKRMKEKERTLLRNELEWMRKGVEARRTKQKARKERFYDLEERVDNSKENAMEINVSTSRLGKKIVEIEHLHKAFGNKVCIKDFSYAALKDDRIGIIGNNGLGKSTLLNIINGELDYDNGIVEVGETVKIGYYSQESRDMNTEMRVIDYIKDKGEYIRAEDGTLISASKMLEKFLFPSHMQYAPIAKLSGGERRRLYLLGVLMNDINVLLLDEPTNDLDIQTLQILEEYIDHFNGPVIAISHDRYFLDKVAEKIFSFEGDGVVEIHAGNYSDYAERKKDQEVISAKTAGKETKVTAEKPKESRKVKLSYKEGREYETIESEIEKLEAKLQKNEEDMVTFATDFTKLNDLIKEKEELEEELLYKMERWEYLTNIVENN